jgi:hypothetical protein
MVLPLQLYPSHQSPGNQTTLPPEIHTSQSHLPRQATTLSLSSRPERNRIYYYALLATTTCAVFRKENRMTLINETNLDRKSGGAKWRDLQCAAALSNPRWKRRNMHQVFRGF